VTGRVAPGWYPDYDAPPGHQRYWDGERWTERRSAAPASGATPVEHQVRRLVPWVLAAVAVLVLVSTAVLVVGDDQTGRADNGSTPPPASSSPGSPTSEQTEPDDAAAPDRRSWTVASVVDGSTVELDNGAEVRLLGVEDSCGADFLGTLVLGQPVALTRRGADKDADGRLLRYVERNGTDVGKRLIQRGLARASGEQHARAAIYRRVDERSADAC
jgi:hypothetical protein